jgi:ABC-type Fe3+ transport system substrate-binding protein
MAQTRRQFLNAASATGTLLFAPALIGRARAQTARPSWLVDESLVAAAQKEGNLVVYTTTNEGEALPMWKLFTDATGIKVQVIRASDSAILGRVMVEARARQKSWDVVQTANVQKFPAQFLEAYEPPEAKNLDADARDKDRRWYGVYANYNTPAYNTKLVNAADLPKSYEEMAKKTEWRGKCVIDDTDTVWLAVMFDHYGEKRAREILTEMAKNLQPVVQDGHLALARAVSAGEYAVILNNYLNLTLNVKMAGGATDFWVLDPVALFYGQVGIASNAPNPNAAKLAMNFQISRRRIWQNSDACRRAPMSRQIPRAFSMA